jgi:DNA repair protein RadC
MSQYSLPFNSPNSFDASVLMVRDVAGDYRPADAAEVLHAAQHVLKQQLRGQQVMTSPKLVREYLKMKLSTLEHEVFGVLMLDAQIRLIECVELFRGTVTQTSVYPREVIKESLARNASALMIFHNHPSGSRRPSPADEQLTKTLTTALGLVDIRVLDHLIVAGDDVVSFAELGLI